MIAGMAGSLRNITMVHRADEDACPAVQSTQFRTPETAKRPALLGLAVSFVTRLAVFLSGQAEAEPSITRDSSSLRAVHPVP